MKKEMRIKLWTSNKDERRVILAGLADSTDTINEDGRTDVAVSVAENYTAAIALEHEIDGYMESISRHGDWEEVGKPSNYDLAAADLDVCLKMLYKTALLQKVLLRRAEIDRTRMDTSHAQDSDAAKRAKRAGE